MKTVRQALSYTFLSSYLSQLSSFAAIIVISRIMTPEDVGIYSVAAVTMLVAGSIRTFGVNQYLISAPELTDEHIRKATGVAILVSWTIAICVFFGAPWFAAYYQEPALRDILRIVAVSFLATPFISVPHAYFSRRMEFEKVIRINVAGTITQSLVSVLLVVAGMSYLGIAMGLPASALVQLLIANRYRRNRIPWGAKFSGIGDVLSFGTFTSFSGMLATTSEGIPDLLIGKLSTMTNVGIFSRGMGLVMIFHRAVTMAVRPVVLPMLSRELRDGGTIAPAYLKAVELHTGLAWPFYAGLSMTAFPVIRLLYGDQWDAAAPLTVTLCLWAVLQSMHAYSNDALIAVRRVKLVFIEETLVVTIRAMAVWYGIQQGLQEVANMFVLAACLELVIAATMVRIGVQVKFTSLLRSCWRSAIVGLLVLITVYYLVNWIQATNSNEFVIVATSGGAAAIVWLSALYVCKHPLFDELLRMLTSVRAKLGR